MPRLSSSFIPILPLRPTLPLKPFSRSLKMSRAGIISPQNPRIKNTRMLLKRRHRDKQNRILLEGSRLLSDALEARITPLEFFYTPTALSRTDETSRLIKQFSTLGVTPTLVSEPLLRTFADTVTPQGLVAVFNRPCMPMPPRPSLTLVCDQIRDPGNLGTLLRTAAAASADAVVLTPCCADLWSLKTLRSGMGAQFRVPVAIMEWAEIQTYTSHADVFVADGGGESVYTDVDWCNDSALVIGGEADGVSDVARGLGNMVKVPMAAGVESMNAAVAGAVMLFEARRQRLVSEPKVYRDG